MIEVFLGRLFTPFPPFIVDALFLVFAWSVGDENDVAMDTVRVRGSIRSPSAALTRVPPGRGAARNEKSAHVREALAER
jgi:hypothetical protein